jgi:hypothetical protein
MPTILDISADMIALHELLTEIGGDVSDEQIDATITTWLTENDTNDIVKLDSYVNVIKMLESEAELATAEAKEYQQRATVRTKRVAWLKRRLMDHLAATGRTKATTATGRTIAIQSNGGKVPVRIDEEVDYSKLEPQFVRYQCSIDVDEVRKHLEGGGTLAFARLGEAGKHIRIK